MAKGCKPPLSCNWSTWSPGKQEPAFNRRLGPGSARQPSSAGRGDRPGQAIWGSGKPTKLPARQPGPCILLREKRHCPCSAIRWALSLLPYKGRKPTAPHPLACLYRKRGNCEDSGKKGVHPLLGTRGRKNETGQEDRGTRLTRFRYRDRLRNRYAALQPSP